jgi:hypothetical protein
MGTMAKMMILMVCLVFLIAKLGPEYWGKEMVKSFNSFFKKLKNSYIKKIMLPKGLLNFMHGSKWTSLPRPAGEASPDRSTLWPYVLVLHA